MNEEFKQLETEIKWLADTVDTNLEKEYNRLKAMSNKELRKEIENANWSYILQMIRHLQAKIERLEEKNKQLKEKLDKYENPEDMTLFVMWCTEKVKDKNKQLEDNWNKLKEYIDIKLYNVEYLQKLCGCRIDDEIHIVLDIIKKEMQGLEQGSDKDDTNR